MVVHPDNIDKGCTPLIIVIKVIHPDNSDKGYTPLITLINVMYTSDDHSSGNIKVIAHS